MFAIFRDRVVEEVPAAVGGEGGGKGRLKNFPDMVFNRNSRSLRVNEWRGPLTARNEMKGDGDDEKKKRESKRKPQLIRELI